jgi:hypothetical protein
MMYGESKRPDFDERITGWLRRIYAAPSGTAYWDSLESRIMARLAEMELPWWTEFDRWAKPALLAAAALLFAAGIAMYRAQQVDAMLTRSELLSTPDDDAVAATVVPAGPREGPLRAVINARD